MIVSHKINLKYIIKFLFFLKEKEMGTTASSTVESRTDTESLGENVTKITDDIYKVRSLTDESNVYTVTVSKNHCTCKAWRFHRKGIPTCKHLDQIRTPPIQKDAVVKYLKPKTKKCTHFHVISAYLPKCTLHNFVYSRKYDGIRIRFRLSDKTAITRKGGMSINISTLLKDIKQNNGDDLEFDAELIHKQYSTHDIVIKELANNRLGMLKLKVFDIIQTTKTFTERQREIQKHIPQDMRVDYHEANSYKHLEGVMITYKENKYEGIVVRNKTGLYLPGHSSNTTAFKIRTSSLKHIITPALIAYT